MGARDVALVVLERVVTQGAFAALALDGEIRRASLSERDAALATTLVYGVLRTIPSLDAALTPHLRREPDPWIRLVLQVAAFQLLHLSRVPPYAAVDAAVTLVRRKRGRGPAGFVNAVLRGLAKDRPEPPMLPRATDLPGWLRASLVSSLGSDRAALFASATELPPPTDLRVVRGQRDELAARLEAFRPGLRASLLNSSPSALRVTGGGDPRRLPGYAEGALAVQELGSQRIVDLVDPQPADRVLDACAGRGGKALALASRCPRGAITAADLHEARLDQIPAEATRLHLDPSTIRLENVDFTVGTAGLPHFDRVLVDAPCTGLGTVHRRPELLLRVGKDDPARMRATQIAILENASTLVRHGGFLVYAVCSPLREEGADVVRAFETANEGFVRLAAPDSTTTEEHGEEGGIRLGPWSPEPTDGYQVYRWRRVEEAG